jgi:hypothetical protein
VPPYKSQPLLGEQAGPVRPLQADPVSTSGNQPYSAPSNVVLSSVLMLHVGGLIVSSTQLQRYAVVVVSHMFSKLFAPAPSQIALRTNAAQKAESVGYDR